MKNHWITQSIDKRFQRIKFYVENQWIGLTTNRPPERTHTHFHSMSINVKIDNLQVTGTPPPEFTKMGLGLTASKATTVMYVYLVGPDTWTAKICLFDPFISQLTWTTVMLPNYKDPAFMLQIENHVDKSVKNWKRWKEASVRKIIE